VPDYRDYHRQEIREDTLMSDKITIIGCGLIGGSLALALKRRRPDLVVACLDLPDRLPAMKEAAIASEIGTLDDAPKHVPTSRLIILATPVQHMLGILDLIIPHLQPGTIVSDVGSTKKQLMLEAEPKMPAGTYFIGGHPMTGSERSGVEAADPLLFSERAYLFCPYVDTPADELLYMVNLAEDLLAYPVTIDAEEHDRIMAMVSHVPQLLATALMNAALKQDATHRMLDTLAGRGFLDMTRLASSDFGVWRGILETNRPAIEEALDQFGKSLASLRTTVFENDSKMIWERAAQRRRRMTVDSRTRPRKADLRDMIDRYDKQLMTTLSHRLDAVRRIGAIKKNQDAPVHDPARESRMLIQRAEWGKALGLPQDLVEQLFAALLAYSNKIQQS
jgi:prephenate dehydrogenase